MDIKSYILIVIALTSILLAAQTIAPINTLYKSGIISRKTRKSFIRTTLLVPLFGAFLVHRHMSSLK